MRWMITGAGGALGTDLVRALDGETVTAHTRASLDVTDPAAVREAVTSWAEAGPGPAVLLNAAAFTAVDLAETDPDGAAAAWSVNAAAPGHLAAACARVGARLVHVSTDYVFPGDRTGADAVPYEPDDPTGPACVYGRSKLAGEERVRAALPGAHHVVRTAWLYGGVGANFVRTVARLLGERDTIDVVTDQRGSPTWSADLATVLVAVARRVEPGRRDVDGGVVASGTLHAAGGGVATWYDLARAIASAAGTDPDRVRPCTSDRFPRPARRPSYSVLGAASLAAAGITPLPPWRDSLAAAVARHPDLLSAVGV